MVRERYSPDTPEPGTATGQMLYWDGTKWTKSDEDKLKWDATNERGTIETVITTRLLAGGVQP